MCLKKYLFAMNPISGAEGFHLQSLLRTEKWRWEPVIKPYRLFFPLRRKLVRVNGKTFSSQVFPCLDKVHL